MADPVDCLLDVQAACPTAGSALSSATGQRCCLGHEPSPVQWPRSHAGQRACTLPAGGAGLAGALPAGASGIISRSESASASSGGGSPSLPRSPSALMTSCAASSVRDREPVLRGAVGSAIAVSLCLRAGNGARTSCGCFAPVAARFVARAVGVVGCGWGSLTLAHHRTPPRAGAERCSPGSAGRSCSGGGLVPPRQRGAVGVSRSPSPSRPLGGRAASHLTGARGVRRWALPLPGRPSLGSGSRGPVPMCVGPGCVGVGSWRCPFGACGLRGPVHCGGGSPPRDLASLREASGVWRSIAPRGRPGPVARVPRAWVVWVWRPCPPLAALPAPGLAAVGVRSPLGVVGGRPGGVAFHRCEGRLVSGAVPLPAARPLGWAARTRCPCVPGTGGVKDPAPAPHRAHKAPPGGGCLVLLRGAPEVRRAFSPRCPPFGRTVGVCCPCAVGAGVRALSLWLSCPAGGCVPRGWWVAVSGGVAFHRPQGRLVSGAVPLLAAHLWGRAWYPGPVVRVFGAVWARGTPYRPHCVRAGTARCGGGADAHRGGYLAPL